MNRRVLNRRSLIVLALIWGGLLAWLTLGLAQSVAGNAQAVQATVLGTTTVLASEASL